MSQEVIDDLRKQLEEANKKAEQNVGGLSAEQFKTFMESRDKGEKDKEKEKEDDYITMGAEGGDGQPLDNSLPLVLNYTGDLPVNNDVLFLIKHKIYVPISLFDNDVINKATASFRQLLPSSFTGTKPLDKARESLGVYHKLSRLLPLGKFLPAFLKNVRAFIAIRVKDEATRSAIYSDAVSFSLDLLNRSAREGTWPLYREYAVDKIEGWMAAFERGASASQNKLTPWDDSLFTKACANLNVSGANDASFKPETSGPATSAWGMMVKLAYETNGSSRLDKVVEQEKSIAAKTIQGVQPAGLVPANLFFKPSFPFMDGASFAFTPPPAAPSFPKQNKGYGGGGYGGGGYGGGQPKFGGGGFPSQVGPQYQAPTFAQQRYTPYPQIKTEQQQQQQPQPPIPTANANTRCITCGGLGHFFKVCPSRGTRVQRQGLEFVTPWPENGGSRTAAPSAVPQGFVPATPAVPDLSADRTEAKEKVSHALHYIPVSLLPERFKHFIELYGLGNIPRFAAIPHMLEVGSMLGITPLAKNAPSYVPPNAIHDPSLFHFVDEKFAKMASRDRIFGPFEQKDVEDEAGPIQSAPLALADKAPLPNEPVRKRITENFSHPHSPLPDGTVSVNSQLDSDDFPCTWTKFCEVEEWMLGWVDKPEVEVAGGDFEDGFEHVGVHPTVRARLVLSWRGKIWIRSVAPFGLSTTPGEFGNLVDCTLEILRAHFKGRLSVINQVDDLSLAFLDPSLSLEEVVEFLSSLGWRLNILKTKPKSRSPLHIGVIWHLDTAIKQLPEEKKQKYLAKVDDALAKKKTVPLSLKQVESIVGCLQYVAMIVKAKRPLLRQLYRFRSHYKKKGALRHWNDKELRVLEKWRTFLAQDVVSASFASPPSPSPLEIAVDASKRALGIWIKQPSSVPSLPSLPFIAAFPLAPGWDNEAETYIGNAEAWAVEAAVEVAIKMGLRDVELTVLSDSDNVIKCWAKGWSRNALLNLSISRLMEITAVAGIFLRIVYVPSADNPADPVSRLVPVPNTLPLPPLYLPEAPHGTVGGRDPNEPSLPSLEVLLSEEDKEDKESEQS